jgi:hypothetical protein
VTPRAVDELERVARSDFGLEVEARLPVDESFSSTVLSFIGTDDRHYVLKRHWARPKAEREIAALRALAGHAEVPELLGTAEHDGTLTLLIEGLDGAPWVAGGRASSELLRGLGRSMGRMHAVPAGSFDGMPSWHALLRGNADRYVASIGAATPSSPDGLATSSVGTSVTYRNRAIPASCTSTCDRGTSSCATTASSGSSTSKRAGADIPRWTSSSSGSRCRAACPRSSTATSKRWVRPCPGPIRASFHRLMQVYAAYHGLAGLAWCHVRDDHHGGFADVNRGLIHQAVDALG